MTGVGYKPRDADPDAGGNGEAAALKERLPPRAATPPPTFAASYNGTITGRLEQLQALPGVLPTARPLGRDGLPAYLAPPGRSVRQRRSDKEDKNYDVPTPRADLPPPRAKGATQTSAQAPPAADRANPAPKPPVPAKSEPESDAAPDKLDAKLDGKHTAEEPEDQKPEKKADGTAGDVAEAGGNAAPAGKEPGGGALGQAAAGAGKGGGSSKRKGKRDDDDLTPFQPLPEVDRGTVTLERPNIQIDTEAPQFGAPRSLTINARRSAEKLEPDVARYADIYGQAAAASHSLYAQIVAALQGQTAQALSDADRASTGRQRELDEALRTLDDGLALGRGRLQVVLLDDYARLDTAAASARKNINRAAAAAIGRLNARATRIDTDLAGKQGERAKIAGMPAAKKAELDAAHMAARKGLAELEKNPGSKLKQPKGDATDKMKAAQFEAMKRDIAFPVKETNLALDEIVKAMADSVLSQVEPTNYSLCMAFCPFDAMKKSLTVDGVKAVNKARSNSLTQLNKTHRKLKRTLARTRLEGERSLINQHRTQRRRIADAGIERQSMEQRQYRQQGRGGAVMLASAAGAQGTALDAIYQRITGIAPKGEAALATAASEYSRGLLANGIPRGQAQLVSIEGRIGQAADTLAKVSAIAGQRFLDGAKGAGATIHDEARRTDETAAMTVRQGQAAMDGLAKPIGEGADSTIRSMNQNFPKALKGLSDGLNKLRDGLNDAFAGTSKKENKEENDKDKNKDKDKGNAPDCSSCKAPAAPEKKDDKKKEGAEKPKAVNDIIKDLVGYGQDPTTAPEVVSYCTSVPKQIAHLLGEKAKGLKSALCISDAEPYKVLGFLRGLTQLQGLAVEEIYNVKGKDLRSDLDKYLNIGNPFTGVTTRVESIRAARDYLNGDTVSGARHELNVCVEWSNDSAQIDLVMKSLSPDEMDKLFHDYPDDMKEVRGDLNSLDTKVFDKLRDHDVRGAIALRGQKAADVGREKRGYEGTDEAGKAIKSMYGEAASGTRLGGGPALQGVEGSRSAKQRTAADWAGIERSFAELVTPEFTPPPDPDMIGPPSPGDVMIAYATRGITYTVDVPNGGQSEGTHQETRHDPVNAAQKRYITALVKAHEGPAVDSARLALELSRPGGANPDRVREAATRDPNLNPALIVDNAPGGKAAAQDRYDKAVAKQNETYALLDEYVIADGTARSTDDVRKIIGDKLAATLSHDKEKADYVRSLVVNDPKDPTFVRQTVAQLHYALDGAGTNVDALRGSLSMLTREQYLAAKKQWFDETGEDLDIRIGVAGKGNWAQRLFISETSGDTALEMERLHYGIPKTEEERTKLDAFEIWQQIREAEDSAAGQAVAREEFDQLDADFRALLAGMGASSMRIGENGEMEFLDAAGQVTELGAFKNGSFVPRPGFTAEDLALAVAAGKASATRYTEATDRIANMIATALVVIAAIVTTALTGGAAASIWIPVLITAAAGVAGMAVKYAIKGGRYGSEEMLFDLASTIISAATAGIGAAAGAALRGGGKAVGALAKTWRMSEQALATAAQGGVAASKALPALTLGQELFIGALTAGFAGGANAAIQPDSWRSDNYAKNILAGIVRGAIGGAIGAGTARYVGKLVGPLGEIPARGIAAGASGAATRIAELSFDDAVMGKHVTWSEITNEASTAFLQNLIQGLGEGAADAAMRSRSASRHAEHEWHQQNSPEAYKQREEALKKLVEAELAQRSAANDNELPPGTVPEAEVPGAARPADGDEQGRVTVAARQPDDDFGPATVRSPIADDEALRAPALRKDGEGEPELMLRSALGGDDDAPVTRREGAADFDPDKTPAHGIQIEHPTFPEGVNLKPGMLDDLPPILENTIIRGTDPKDGAQARQNYEIMRSRLPGQEVLLAFNPTTDEYMVVQGLTRSVKPPPEGWITLRHTHPQVSSNDRFAIFASILPSGIGGDFSVLRTELDRLAAASPNAVVRRSSAIDIDVNGQRVVTVFEISKQGDNYSLTVTLHPPQHGVTGVGPVTGTRDEALRQYAYKARDLTSGMSDFGLGHNPKSGVDYMSADARAGGPSRVVRGATLAETESHNAAFVAQRMAQADASDRQARGLATRGEADPAIVRAASTSDAHERVRQMGLVGEPDSLQRLTRLLNSTDPAFTPEMRSALARATLEATRIDLVRSGNLAPGDELVMLFRGVTGARTNDYEAGGIDLSRLGPGRDEDAGRGLYGSQDFESARNYAGTDGKGAVLPLIVRQSELGNVIDVRSGTPLGDRWLAFIRATAHEGRLMPGYPHLSGVLVPGIDAPMGLGRGGRGARFEQFLASLAADPSLPPAIREAARDPHITLMDLGGVASWGNDRRMLTDQFAMHHQRIADLFNVAHGFPLPGRGSAGEEPPAVLRSALGDDGTVPSTPKPKQDEPATEAPKAGDKVDEAAPLVAPGIDETAMPTVQPKADSEETTPGPQAAKATAPDTTAGVATPKKPTTGVEALQQFGIDFSAEKSRASIGRRVAEVADLLPEDHPMREALRDIGKQLSSRKRRFPDGQDPWTRLANLSLDTDFGEMIARELNRPLPKGEDEAAARRTEIRRDMSAKRNVAEETDRGGDLRALHAEELAEVAPSQRRPPNRRMREVQATPEYSLLATDMPVLARGPNGAIDPAEGQRIADTMRAFHGFDEGRNVALAELRVENASQLLISKSNNEVLPGLTTLPQDRLFATFDVNARPGDNHTESVLLEHTARVIDAGKFANNQEAAFAVSMYTERAPCESCQGVIAQFAQRYPDIAARSMVSWSGPPAGQASFLDVAAGLAP